MDIPFRYIRVLFPPYRRATFVVPCFALVPKDALNMTVATNRPNHV